MFVSARRTRKKISLLLRARCSDIVWLPLSIADDAAGERYVHSANASARVNTVQENTVHESAGLRNAALYFRETRHTERPGGAGRRLLSRGETENAAAQSPR